MHSLSSRYIPKKYQYFTTWARTALYGTLKTLQVTNMEVLVPAFTCNTTVVDAILQVGAKPLFVDIELPSLDLNLFDLENKITPKSRVLISHHYYGYVSQNLNEVNEICQKYNLWHIEDCAHSLGAKLRGRLTGSWGDAAIYSFSKTMINPGGGCIATSNRSLFHEVCQHYEQDIPLDSFFKNCYCFHYLLNIYRDLHSDHLLTIPAIYLTKTIIFLLRYLLRYEKERILGGFYRQGGLKRKELEYVNISMTPLQGFFIHQKLRRLPQKLKRRQRLFKMLEGLIPPAIDCREMEAVYGYYLFKTSQKVEMIKEAGKRGIRLRETWPAFQDYWEVQKTANVKSLANDYLLLDIGQYCEEKDISTITELFYDYRN
jgi:dTDP-4-amino-4,6-dideoxygalactose transaminase